MDGEPIGRKGEGDGEVSGGAAGEGAVEGAMGLREAFDGGVGVRYRQVAGSVDITRGGGDPLGRIDASRVEYPRIRWSHRRPQTRKSSGPIRAS